MKKKKFAAIAVSGLLSLAVVSSLVGCGGGSYDREAPAFGDADATLSLTAETGTAISPTLFGAFLEDINYASYALDDNLLANGSFETPLGNNTRSDYGWTAQGVTFNTASGAGSALGELYKDYQNNYVNGGYATVKSPATGGSLFNSGYADPAMAVTAGTDYVFTAFIKSASNVTLTLNVTDGAEVYATGTLEVTGGSEWVKYQKKIKATKTGTQNLKFELGFGGEADLSLDGVKLETTDSVVGIKSYLYNAIEELSPKFIRFPGGCVIEGASDASAYDWKNSIGAVAQSSGDVVPEFTYRLNKEGTVTEVTTRGEQITRRSNTDIWYASGQYYEMEYGIGFYDYFVLCNVLGASPVPVISCGLSDQGGLANRDGKGVHALTGRHGNGKQDYIQDAKDLVCFANGSVNSSDPNEAYWAQVRTDMGSPAPFNLKYLGIGNEQRGAYYTDYYEKFIEAFKADENPIYSNIELIVGNAMTFGDIQQDDVPGTAQRAAQTYLAKQLKTDDPAITAIAEYGIHDHHYYMNYLDFFTNTTVYDMYTRPSYGADEYYNVFVGEYSANSYSSGGESYAKNSEWTNSWITALSEAAMMTAYERNGDIIKLAAYAPMFASWQGGRQWQVDMMYFTNTDLVRSTNYYVQQLFMRHSGVSRVKSEKLTYAAGFARQYELEAATNASGGTRTETIDKLYYTAALNADGDLVVKIVNASPDEIKLNIAIDGASLRGTARVSELQNDNYKAVNTLENTSVSPEEYTIGKFTKKTVGYAAKAYSVTAIVIDLK